MNSLTQNDTDHNAAIRDAEQSLRLIASLPAPAGMEDRVKAGLRSAPASAVMIKWPLLLSAGRGWAQGSYLRTAAAAAIVLVVAGGAWGVHARFQSASSPAAEAVPQRIGGDGGFSPAGAIRIPRTVQGPAIATPQGVSSQPDVSGANPARRHDKKNSPKTPAKTPAVR